MYRWCPQHGVPNKDLVKQRRVMSDYIACISTINTMQHGGIQWDVLLTLWITLDWSIIITSILTRFKTTLSLCPSLSPDVNQV